jgi:hypothetical protein
MDGLPVRNLLSLGLALPTYLLYSYVLVHLKHYLNVSYGASHLFRALL